uniref:Uncharacterized protein n=1 Tax=Sander lucioperca TaxID=283035 RepID=A0A8C9YZV8_SANLU
DTKEFLIWEEVPLVGTRSVLTDCAGRTDRVPTPLSRYFRLLNWLMNGTLWSYTPQNPLFSGYNFLSSNLNVAFERGG